MQTVSTSLPRSWEKGVRGERNPFIRLLLYPCALRGGKYLIPAQVFLLHHPDRYVYQSVCLPVCLQADKEEDYVWHKYTYECTWHAVNPFVFKNDSNIGYNIHHGKINFFLAFFPESLENV